MSMNIAGTVSITVQRTGRDYRGHDAEWDETLSVAYRVNPVDKTVEVLDVRDACGFDFWDQVRDSDWQRIEERCIEHACLHVGP